MEFGERKKKILKAIVDEYIKSGEPVGSKSLIGIDGLSVSSATLRNEMADLESMGYIEKPHISAGRVPSIMGYREYVDNLMGNYMLSKNELKYFSEIQNKIGVSNEDFTRFISKKLTEILGYTTLVVTFRSSLIIIRRLELLPIDEYHIAVVVISNDGNVNSFICKLTNTQNIGRVAAFAVLLNNEVTDKHIENLDFFDEVININPQFADFKPVIDAIKNSMSERQNYDVMIDGAARLLSFPEYAELDRVKLLLQAFDSKEELIKMFHSIENDKSVQVLIGNENELSYMQFASIVSGYFNNGNNHSFLGVIGPTRMDYSRVLASLNHIINKINYFYGQ